jgi:nitroreductase
MKRLGEILLERGAIAVAELHTGLEACHYRGGRLGTQLLRFGFVDEHALLEALSEQLGVPPVPAQVLRRAPMRLRQLLPADVSRRLQAMVFDRRDGMLSIAMTSPRNPSAIEELVSYVGLDIKPHVATELGILSALRDLETDEDEAQSPRAPTPAPVPGHGVGDLWDKLWTPHALTADDLLHPRGGPPKDEIPPAATFPGLTPVPLGRHRKASGPLLDEAFSALLRDVEHRDEVGELLLRRAAAILERCCLLACHSGKIVGWLGRGPGVVIDDVQSFAVEDDAPSVMSGLAAGASFAGPMPSGVTNQLLIEMLGDPMPNEVVVVPVLVKNRVVAYVLGDVPRSSLPAGAVEGLHGAVQKAGVALEILIMKKKFLA